MKTGLEAAGLGAIRFWQQVFFVAALYDIILGVVFFLFQGPIFDALGVPVGTSAPYMHLSAGFVFVQGVGYWFVYRDMLTNIGIVKVGTLYKIIYTAVAVYYLALGQLPNTIFIWFAFFDIVFLAFFIRFLSQVRPQERPA